MPARFGRVVGEACHHNLTVTVSIDAGKTVRQSAKRLSELTVSFASRRGFITVL